MGLRTLSWVATAALLPQPEQRVVWFARQGGGQVRGQYIGDNRWMADPDERHDTQWRIDYTPSNWRPE